MQFNKISSMLSVMLFLVGGTAHAKNINSAIDFNIKKYNIEKISINNKNITVRAYTDIIYVKHPIDTKYELMNIYIPDSYFHNGSINGYTAQTAPIFFHNNIGGYMPAEPATLLQKPLPNMPKSNKSTQQGPKSAHTIALALAEGYVVAAPGARGRTNSDGKAPAALVDLKAAVRYLKYNDQKMPGDANKIISNGTSAGGAISTLLGATGDSQDFIPYLNKIGAANTSDQIFAVSAYCPITDLEHADSAYEWQLNNIHHYEKMDIKMLDYKVERKLTAGVLTEKEIHTSNDLKKQFPKYLNGLHLLDQQGKQLTLDDSGNGNFKDLMKNYVMQSAQDALDAGEDVSKYSWIIQKDHRVIDINVDDYLKYLGRAKIPPAFDALDLSSGENQLFGTSNTDKQHFTEYSYKNSSVKNSKVAVPQMIKMMNPLYYLTADHKGNSQYWRIRHGTYDKDTSLAISMILATKLEKDGKSVDYKLAWNKPHSGDYDLMDLFKWINKISK